MAVIMAASGAGRPMEPAESRRVPTNSSVGLPSASAVPTPIVATAGKPFSPGVLRLGVRKVAIDAGHGGTSHGTSSAHGISEKFVTLDIARRLRLEMQARGFHTVMTRRETTVSLQQRAAIANAGDADVFVSVHLNSFRSPTTLGIETYYLGPSDDDELDAIAESENQHSGYSMADLRSLLDKIFADARRDESSASRQRSSTRSSIGCVGRRDGRRPGCEGGALRGARCDRHAGHPGRSVVSVDSHEAERLGTQTTGSKSRPRLRLAWTLRSSTRMNDSRKGRTDVATDTRTNDGVLSVGIDLGTSRSAISSSTGEQFVVDSFVGWPTTSWLARSLGAIS